MATTIRHARVEGAFVTDVAHRWLAWAACTLLSTSAAIADCQPQWVATFGGAPGMFWSGGAATVWALSVFDDGSGAGPALFAAGEFSSAGGVSATSIAKWDGIEWTALGSGVNGVVRTLAAFDDGSGGGPALYAGGSFSTAGSVSANYVAKWDGATWSSLGGQPNGLVYALMVFDDGLGGGPALYAGGSFTSAGGAIASRIAKWNGVAWSPLGSGMNAGVAALTVYNDELIAGGAFTTAGGVSAIRIAKWDGVEWAAVGRADTFFYPINALTVFDDGVGAGPALIASGSGFPAVQVLKWDGGEWSALGSGMAAFEFNHHVSALASFDDGHGRGAALYAGGKFQWAGGVFASNIAQWDGISWSSVAGGVLGFQPYCCVFALTPFDDGLGAGPALVAGGGFTSAGGLPLMRVAKYANAEWSGLGSGLPSQVDALATFDDGAGCGPALYVGGQFAAIDGQLTRYIAKWSGTTWSLLGSGMNNQVHALTLFDDGTNGAALYAGGEFTTAGGLAANRIAKWDGTTWSPLGGGVNNSVRAMTAFDDGLGDRPALYAGGTFSAADGMPANRIAKWDGIAWSPLGSGLNQSVNALLVFDDGSGLGPALYVGGGFSTAGDTSASRIARWDGVAWSPLGSGVSEGSVYALAAFDDGLGDGPMLYVGGYFQIAGGVPAVGIARWHDDSWTPVGGGMGGFIAAVLALTVFDDGKDDGPALFAGGDFTTAGSVTINGIARWDGLQWSALDDGISFGPIHAFAAFDDGLDGGESLFVGGGFPVSPAGDSFLAKWQPCRDAPCAAADLNHDGQVSGFDLALMLAAWTGAASYAPCPPSQPADLNQDCKVNGMDLAILLGAWGPCP